MPKKKRIKKICKTCNNSFEVIPYFKNAKYCCKQCYYVSKKGHTPWNKGKKCPSLSKENNPNWKGGRKKTTQGYIVKLNHSHPKADRWGYVKEQILVAEKALKRFLTEEEVIHHINEIKIDNRLENLYLFESNSKHISYHLNLRWGNIKKINKSNLISQI